MRCSGICNWSYAKFSKLTSWDRVLWQTVRKATGEILGVKGSGERASKPEYIYHKCPLPFHDPIAFSWTILGLLPSPRPQWRWQSNVHTTNHVQEHQQKESCVGFVHKETYRWGCCHRGMASGMCRLCAYRLSERARLENILIEVMRNGQIAARSVHQEGEPSIFSSRLS